MNKKILIMKTGTTIPSLLATGEDFEDWFISGSGQNFDLFHCCAIDQDETLPNLDGIAGIIITGSPAYLTDLAPWNFVAADYLRAAHNRHLPLLGVCYGHQLLAWAFAGKVGFHGQGREIGTVEISLTREGELDPLLSSMTRSFKAQVSHQQSVLNLPLEAVHLAGNDFEPNHAFRIGQSTWGVQFHPEFSADIVSAYIRERRDVIEAEGLNAELLLSQLEDTPESAALLKKFTAIVLG